MSYDQTKKFARRFYHEDYISKKIFGARALPRSARGESHIAVKTQKSRFFGMWAEYSRRERVQVRARPNFFRNQKVE